MGRSRRIVRGVFTAVIFALLILCATAVFIPASKWAKAENTYESKSDGLGDIDVTYVIAKKNKPIVINQNGAVRPAPFCAMRNCKYIG